MQHSQYALNDDQRQIQDLIRRVAREKVAPRANDIDSTAEYPHDMYALLKELGLFTLPFPEQYGGAGSMLSACLAIEEFGRVCYNTAYLLLVQWVPFGAILHGGTDAQKARLLPGLASGELRGAFSTTEAQSGSDVSGIKTRAEKTAHGFVLNGAKIWCTNSDIADFILVAAKYREGEKDGISLFIVEKGTPGLQVGRKEEKMGARGVPSCPLFLDNVSVPAENMLGGGFKAVMEAFNASRPLIGARGVGLAQGALDHAVEFVSGRTAFGQQVSDFQGVRWMLADMAMKTEAARHLVYRAASLVDSGAPAAELAPVAAMAKCFATDTAMQVATDAVQLFGAAGISSEYPINRYFRDAKVLQIIEGTNQIQRNIISNGLLGRPTRK
ncbi:Acyl-CoA dehydrogenase%2C short-chain specific [Achromobacter xylosoxidans]|uniref:acyl-CoA dehydrogenase family protein n=1 Tax=Alcaligenes xylosoxydans xylosoxydans TaxID=85698 RepID=UPI0006C508B0|nr:acyl-CoA dehydrogenase family protein [Achromobacter xylosoxidans]MDX3880707.1 acyl-CoA dehydrogenase family protein [Achromobacter sp.]CUJ39260.1 Acyl-CoA dehydrogenase%2C short-chain specific [Achromobacter xylosoxidans]CUJ50707.1 Acyl-CoA dehydrogenase%2C short-chain specific [Achromobacter xylosoxidans]